MNAMIPPHPHSGFPGSEFERRVLQTAPHVQRAEHLSTITINVGGNCDLACGLCHLRCSPSRTETMQRGVMLNALTFTAEVHPDLLDLTGGEPTLWPLLREFLQLARDVAPSVRVHTNLVSFLGPQGPAALQSLVETRTEILASLPEMLEGRTVTECMEALAMLSSAGYGDPVRGEIPLDIAYTPMAGELPRPQDELEQEYREALAAHGIGMCSLVPIAHVPLGGFADWLEDSGGRTSYETKLQEAFDPSMLADLPCRHGIEIGWNGTLWDCDYHLAARHPITETPRQVGDYVSSPVGQASLATRRITFAEHCFACAVRRRTVAEENGAGEDKQANGDA
jgi:radical SAM/Cys-rich protein